MFFLSLGFIFLFFNLLNFYPVTRFLVTPLLVTRYCVTLFSNTPSDYSFAHGNRYRELTIDYTQRLSALIVHILKMRLTGQNRLVS